MFQILLYTELDEIIKKMKNSNNIFFKTNIVLQGEKNQNQNKIAGGKFDIDKQTKNDGGSVYIIFLLLTLIYECRYTLRPTSWKIFA